MSNADPANAIQSEYSDVECCAIIPARGGSKGIPRKNVRLLAGKPLVAYTIEHALQAPSVSRVIVSTDDREIGSVSQEYGAEVVWRPADISGDTASSESALLHALDHLRDSEGYEPDLVVFPQATSPLRAPDDIQNGIETLLREGADSLFSACSFHWFLWRREGGRLFSVNFDYNNRPLRQAAPEDVIENGSFFVFKTDLFRKHKNRMVGKITVYLMPLLNSLQVDEPDDLVLIEHVLATRRSRVQRDDESQDGRSNET